jgi:nuclear transport factor 2 (NTF2) superfamily protein
MAMPESFDPVGYLAEIERAWQARDGTAAVAGYSADAVVIFGTGQSRSGDDLRSWPARWFEYAADLRIRKTFRAFTGNCLASEWESEYTHPVSGKAVKERGAEFFFIRPDGKVYLHHMFEHTWFRDEEEAPRWPAI